MTFNHVPSHNKPIDGGDFRYKSKAIDDVSPIFDVDESANNQTKLMFLVDDGSIIPYGEPVEQFLNFTEFDGDDIEPEE